jgi:gluconate 5-dehydrogenase
MKSFSLEGKSALVTGASRGLGWAMAVALAEAGAHVVLNARDAELLEQRRAELEGRGLSASVAAFDVAHEAAAVEAVARINGDRGLDILVNNAGIVHRQPVTELPTADWQRVLDINLTACFVLAREAAKPMIDRGWGRIVNIASIMSKVARSGIPPYVTTKHAVAGLTKALAVELGPKGINCNAICPGYFATDLNQALVKNPEFDGLVRGRTPLARWGEEPELGPAAVFLASDAASYVNGHLLVVDGGMTVNL